MARHAGVIYRLYVEGLVNEDPHRLVGINVREAAIPLTDDELCDAIKAAMETVRPRLNPPKPGFWDVPFELPDERYDWRP
jgi:hypothetical protein